MQKPVKPEKKTKGEILREQIFAKKEELGKLSAELKFEELKQARTATGDVMNAARKIYDDACKKVGETMAPDGIHTDYYSRRQEDTWTVSSVSDEFKAAVEKEICATADEIRLFSPCASFTGILSSIVSQIIRNDQTVIDTRNVWLDAQKKFEDADKNEQNAQRQLGMLQGDIHQLEHQYCTWERRRKAQTGELQRELDDAQKRRRAEREEYDEQERERNRKYELERSLKEAERIEKYKALDYKRVGNALGVLNELATGTRKLEWPLK